jgi:hypothetical protein
MRYLATISLIALLTLTQSFFTLHAYAQRDVEERVRKPKPKPKPRAGAKTESDTTGSNRQPKSQPKSEAKTESSTPVEGEIAIETNPTSVNVIVKSPDGKIVVSEEISNGKFAKKLPPGKYNVEVTAEGYALVQKEAVIKSSEKETIPILLTPNTGTIVLGPVKQDAIILLNGQDPASMNIRVRRLSDHVELKNVKEGMYAVRVEAPGYLPVVRDKIEIRGGLEVHLRTDLEEAGADLLIITDPGTSVYLDDEYIGEASREGKLRRSSVSAGGREVKLKKQGYEDFKSTYQFPAGKEIVIEKRLSALKTAPALPAITEDFGGNLSRWATTASAGWSLKNGRLEIANMNSLGYLRNSNYKDFTVSFNLKLVNGAGAAWAVRAASSKDYYLFYLSGSKGLFKKRFNTYIVRNNSFNPQNPANETILDMKMSAGDEYKIIITVTQNRIEHKIAPADTGLVHILGVFEDLSSLFPSGTIGFRTVGPEIFSVDDLSLIPLAPADAK